MGAKSQRKGRAGEIELMEILRARGYMVKRGGSQTYGTVPDLTGLPGVHVECKRAEKLDLLGAIHQAERDAEKFRDGLPCVFHRRNRSPWLVTMTLDNWMKLYEEEKK